MIIKVIKIESYSIKLYVYINVEDIIAIDAIDSPNLDKTYISSSYKTFKVYFNNYVFNIDTSCYEGVLKAWLLVKNKSLQDVPLSNYLKKFEKTTNENLK